MAEADYSGVLALLAEKLGLSPAEFAAATVVIKDGVVTVAADEAVAADAPIVEAPAKRGA